MKIDLGQTINTLANVGVIGGLVFIGFQLIQDRQIAAEQMVRTAGGHSLSWAELVSSNNEIWVRGLAGETLDSAEAATFVALAESWDFLSYTNWRGQILIGDDEFAPTFPRKAARELSENPGLRAWYRQFVANLEKDGQLSEYERLVTLELERIESD